MIAMLTTIDNPYNPFEQFDEWYNYDMRKGYNSCGVVARLARTSPELSDDWNNFITENAIDRIVDLNPNGMWIKVLDDKKKSNNGNS